MSKPALLLLNGEIPEPALVRRLARSCGVIVCADGGARHAAALRLEPNFIVGDMDSLPRPLPKNWRRTVYWCDFDQNRSDFEKALELLRAIGCRRLYVAGALGGRLDHALINLALAAKEAKNISITLIDRGMAAYLGPGRHRFDLSRGARLSLLAAGNGALLSASGLRYPLKRSRLAPGARGLGNVVTGPVFLTVHTGAVWAAS